MFVCNQVQCMQVVCFRCLKFLLQKHSKNVYFELICGNMWILLVCFQERCFFFSLGRKHSSLVIFSPLGFLSLSQ